MALRNTRVVEFAGLAPAPFAGLVLADWGADVVRIDRPSTTHLDILCRHKRSIVVDVKHPEGLQVLRRLIARADVLIDPFRAGVMERVGLGPELFLGNDGLNKKLVYARLAGFAHTAECYPSVSFLSTKYYILKSCPQMLPGDETKPGFPLNLVADFGGGGLTCALGILLALIERQSSGLGQVVSTNMVSGTRYLSTFPLLSAMQWPYKTHSPLQSFAASPDAGSNFPNVRMKHLLDGGAPFYNVYTCADGRWMSVGCLEPQFYKQFLERFVAALPSGFVEAAEGSELSSVNQYDTDRWPRLKDLFEKAFKLYDRNHWAKVFEGSDACAFPVLSAAEAAVLASNEHAAPTPHPQLSRTPARPLPAYRPEEGVLSPGQHTVEVLMDLGLDADKIVGLAERGALGAGEKTKL
ncbi:CoA-transferase family III domain-containing protein [Cytidiella melzeri]|nr:CoA-transferase family III domain-containing protein [Cytidiella melzeri]